MMIGLYFISVLHIGVIILFTIVLHNALVYYGLNSIVAWVVPILVFGRRELDVYLRNKAHDKTKDERDRWRQTALNNADRLDEVECVVTAFNVAIHEAKLSHICDDYPISVTVAELEAILADATKELDDD